MIYVGSRLFAAGCIYQKVLKEKVSLALNNNLSHLEQVDDIELENNPHKWNESWRRPLSGKYTHHILLFRHGEYEQTGKLRHLSCLGKDQAKCMGQEVRRILSGFGQNFKLKVYSSTVLTAMETYMEAKTSIGFKLGPPEFREDLRENVPHAFSPSWPGYQPGEPDNENAENVFQDIFCEEIKEDTVSLIFGHSNVTRYLFFRALQLPLDAYMRAMTLHGSITWLTIEPRGEVFCPRFGEFSFLGTEEITGSA